jgi:Flp pilus assembly protein TadG
MFVAIFSVILGMGAFALDQGLAYGKHGVAQGAADAASRAGAYGCLLDLSDNTSSNCGGTKATTGATKNANANLNANVILTNPNCPGSSGGSFPSVAAEIDKTSPSLFGRGLGVGNYTAKAITTTCVGTVTTVSANPSVSALPLPLMPIWFAGTSSSSGSDPNKSNCGAGSSNSATFAGRMCVVFTTDSHLQSAGTFYDGSAASVKCGPSSSGNIDNAISGGGLTTFKCTVPGSGVTGVSSTVTDYYGSSSWARSILDAFEGPLPASGEPCSGGWVILSAIQNVVQTLGGNTAKPAGATSGSADPVSTVYRQQNCASKRLVLVPLVNNTGSSTKTISGFAAVYIVGCSPSNKTASQMLSSGLNECDTGDTDRGSDDGGQCQNQSHGHCNDSGSERNTNVWGIVLRVYAAGDPVQQIGPIGNNGAGKAAALSMQTVK